MQRREWFNSSTTSPIDLPISLERVFDRAEREYIVFMQNPPIGFILNVPRDSKNKWDWFKMHRSDCALIGARGTRPSRQEGTWTEGETFKVFADTWGDLLAAYDSRRDHVKGYVTVDPALLCRICQPTP